MTLEAIIILNCSEVIIPMWPNKPPWALGYENVFGDGFAVMAKQAGADDPQTLRRYWAAKDQFPEDDPSWPY